MLHKNLIFIYIISILFIAIGSLLIIQSKVGNKGTEIVQAQTYNTYWMATIDGGGSDSNFGTESQPVNQAAG